MAEGAVTSVSMGATGLTPAVATTGAITVGGTLIVAHGGTGATTLTTNGVLIGNGVSAISAVDLSTKGSTLIGNGAWQSCGTWSRLRYLCSHG